jgi:hypothetical protein
MYTLDGFTLARDESLLLSVINTPPAAAGFDSVTGSTADECGATVTPDASVMSERVVTVTVAFPGATFAAVVVAAITAVPGPEPVTGTVTLVELAPNVTAEGTVATVVLSDLSDTISPPAGAGAERVSVRFAVFVP